MRPGIPDGSWRVNANDPTALTRLLDLPDLAVTGLEYDDTKDTLHVFCKLQATTAICPTCQQSPSQRHQYSKRALRDLPMSGKRCLLEVTTRRFYCVACQCPFREELDWLPRNSRLLLAKGADCGGSVSCHEKPDRRGNDRSARHSAQGSPSRPPDVCGEPLAFGL